MAQMIFIAFHNIYLVKVQNFSPMFVFVISEPYLAAW
jgi:hypothetical protein